MFNKYSLAAISSAFIFVASAASADAIFVRSSQNFDTNLSLDIVRASDNGTVEIYNYHGGMRGDLLGMSDVNAGSNTDVKVKIKPTSSEDLLAVLIVNDKAVAMEELSESN